MKNLQREIDKSDNPEQKLLLQILEKMLSKHKNKELVDKSNYMTFKPRQWETIEDRLMSKDLKAEFPTLTVKSYVDQIKQII